MYYFSRSADTDVHATFVEAAAEAHDSIMAKAFCLGLLHLNA